MCSKAKRTDGLVCAGKRGVVGVNKTGTRLLQGAPLDGRSMIVTEKAKSHAYDVFPWLTDVSRTGSRVAETSGAEMVFWGIYIVDGR